MEITYLCRRHNSIHEEIMRENVKKKTKKKKCIVWNADETLIISTNFEIRIPFFKVDLEATLCTTRAAKIAATIAPVSPFFLLSL